MSNPRSNRAIVHAVRCFSVYINGYGWRVESRVGARDAIRRRAASAVCAHMVRVVLKSLSSSSNPIAIQLDSSRMMSDPFLPDFPVGIRNSNSYMCNQTRVETGLHGSRDGGRI